MKHLISFLAFLLSISMYADNNYDVIFTIEKEQIQCNIKEISDNSVSFVRADKPTTVIYSMSKDKIVLIQFADGTIETFATKSPNNLPQQTQTIQQLPTDQISASTTAPKDYAIAQLFGGTYVFNDCTPVDEYEVLGEISFNKNDNGIACITMPNGIGGTTNMIPRGGAPQYTPTPMPNGMGGGITTVVYGGETPQYTSIRNGLIANAVMANRAVEGIIITEAAEGKGRATMIKFVNKSNKNRLAIVNRHRGLYVFSDCQPVNSYTSIKKIKGELMYLSSAYNYIRDKLLAKAVKKKDCNAVIITLVEGGIDYVEAIHL